MALPDAPSALLVRPPRGRRYARGVPRTPEPEQAPTDRPLERWLVGLALVAAWSVVPPYLGPVIGLELDVTSSLELVDHVIPGLSAVAAALLARSEVRRGNPESIIALAALGVSALAGFFQTVTHFTLVMDAGGPLQPVGAVVLHATPGPLVMALSLWLMLRAPAQTQPTR